MRPAIGLDTAFAGRKARQSGKGGRPGTKLDAAAETLARVLFFPFFLAQWLLELPERVVLREPEHYGRCTWQEPYAKSTITFASPHHRQQAQAKVSLHAWEPNLANEHAADGKIILQRFQSSWQDSLMLTVQGIIYYVVQHLLRFFAIDQLLFMFRKEIHGATAWSSGAHYETTAGQWVDLSPLAAMTTDRTFTTPSYSACSFPAAASACECSPNVPDSHFLCQCARLVYEDSAIIQDVVTHRWQMVFHGQQSIPAHDSRHCWVPDVCYFSCSNAQALVLSLKGADPLWQLSLAADPPTSKSPRPGLGQVHKGLWQGLHQADPFCRSRTLYDALVAQLRLAQQSGKAIYLTGHSLGGALAILLAGILLQREPELAVCIKGIITFAATRVGDAAFAERFDAAYGGRCLRFVNGADMVTMLPPRRLGFKHTGDLCHLTSRPVNGSRLVMTEERSRVAQQEDRWGYANALRKLFSSYSQGENIMRFMLRIVMLPLPGFSDHLPSCYEKILRDELLKMQPAS